MSFDYNAIRSKKHSSGTQWAAYSDLFMVLAFIFLLLYMVSSLRAGMFSIVTHAQIEEVKQELQVYESIKNEYLEGEASLEEKKIYEDIVKQLSLLESEANKNKNQLAKQYNEQKIREDSLNKYQQMIMTMVNANTIAKSDAFKVISSEKQQNRSLENEIARSKNKLALLDKRLQTEERERSDLLKTHRKEKENLAQKFEDLKNQRENDQDNLASLSATLKIESAEKQALKNTHNAAKQALERKFKNLKDLHDEGQNQLSSLENRLIQEEIEKETLANAYKEDTTQLENKLKDLEYSDEKKQEILSSLEDQLKEKEAEKDALKDAYSEAARAMENKIDKLKNKHADSQKQLASLNDKNSYQVAKLSSDLDNARKTLKDKSKDLDKTKRELKNKSKDLAKKSKDLDKKSKDLEKAIKLAQRRKDIAKRIKDNFRKNGINADVDGKTGDVYLDFGENYFDTDSHQLKAGMKKTIRKAIPVYAQSLFGSEMLASKISSVEIIGFASPTYAGKPVDPTELSVANRTAVNYNLDLSYKRARSIFEYVFDTGRLKFTHQDTMVHLINVTGRSFFAEKINLEDTGDLTIDEFCGQYNCKKSQRVIIKFGLDEKGAI